MRLARLPRRSLPWHPALLIGVGNGSFYQSILRHRRFFSSASTASNSTTLPDHDGHHNEGRQSSASENENGNPRHGHPSPADQINILKDGSPPEDPSSTPPSITVHRFTTPGTATPRPAKLSFDLQTQLTPLSTKFPRWVHLAKDSRRMAKESDFKRKFPDRLVDRPENRFDAELWACLLNFRHRVKGHEGVLELWPELWSRRHLFGLIHDPYFQMIWQTVLRSALYSEDVDSYLESMRLYVEETQSRTPGEPIWHWFYMSIITHFLRYGDHPRALRWHLRLCPTIPPTEDGFITLLKEFCTGINPSMVDTLHALYISWPRCRVYDQIVPYLYSCGEVQLSVQWRDMLVLRDDAPQLAVLARPFVRYLKGYYPDKVLHPKEEEILEFQEGDDGVAPEISAEMMNLAHGEVFGVAAKNYDDTLGARWFASSWVSLDSAISTVATLGIEQIGPLSFQSIALREESSEGVLKRLDQLRDHKITVVESAYTRILTRFAHLKDDELLFNLLQSDIHPDVWENIELQNKILESTAAVGDWPTHLMVLTARMVALEHSARDTANALLSSNIKDGRNSAVLSLLNDMRSMKIGINYEQVNQLFRTLYKRVTVHEFNDSRRTAARTTSYTNMCLRLVTMNIPVPSWAWIQLTQSLGRLGKIDELEELCLNLVEIHTKSQGHRPGYILIHWTDAPVPMRRPLKGVEKIMGVYIPENTPLESDEHPLNKIFDQRMIGSIVRWSFSAMMNSPLQKPLTLMTRKPQAPASYHCWRGVRLLRIMKERGVRISSKPVVRAAILRLVELYGPEDIVLKDSARQMRNNNTVPMNYMKGIADLAWTSRDFELSHFADGSDTKHLLPPLKKLESTIDHIAQRHRKQINHMAADKLSAEIESTIDYTAKSHHKKISRMAGNAQDNRLEEQHE